MKPRARRAVIATTLLGALAAILEGGNLLDCASRVSILSTVAGSMAAGAALAMLVRDLRAR